MSLRCSSNNRTLCEVLREINDVLQDHVIHKQILPKLIEAEKMGKRMAGKLMEYNKQVFADWWEKNPDYEADMKLRLNKNYITEEGKNKQESTGLLKKLALKYKADKTGDSVANYTDNYEAQLVSFKNKFFALLEIGVSKGGSLKMWKGYFPNAKIVGVDIDHNCLQFADDRIKIYIGDQTDSSLWDTVFKEQSFDIIIDDGGHHVHQQQIAFNLLFPRLNAGGVYVIEDLHTSYWPDFGGQYNKADTTVSFLKKFIDGVNWRWYKELSRPNESCTHEKPTYFDLNIKSLHFYNGICFIYKK